MSCKPEHNDPCGENEYRRNLQREQKVITNAVKFLRKNHSRREVTISTNGISHLTGEPVWVQEIRAWDFDGNEIEVVIKTRKMPDVT